MIAMMIVMFLPVIALPVFLYLPLGAAIPIYAACLLLWGAMMWIMRASMKRTTVAGAEALVGKQAEVIRKLPSDPVTPYRVRLQGEIWRASSGDSLQQGQMAVITGVEGNKLKVKRPIQHPSSARQ